MQHALRLTIIYHTEWWNARNKIKKRVVLSKMPLDKGSAAMGFQVGFKSVGFFSVFECYCVFDTPRFVFWCVRNITFIVFFKAGFQVFGSADIEMGSGGLINEYVYVVKVRHRVGIFQNNVCGSAVPCCPAPSAVADYAAAVFPSGFARLRRWLAEAKS